MGKVSACSAREGTCWQGDKVTWVVLGRDAVVPLPNPIEGTRGQGDMGCYPWCRPWMDIDCG